MLHPERGTSRVWSFKVGLSPGYHVLHAQPGGGLEHLQQVLGRAQRRLAGGAQQDCQEAAACGMQRAQPLFRTPTFMTRRSCVLG